VESVAQTELERLDELTPDLSEAQQLFLNTRRTTSTDREAYEEIGYSRSSINNWKKELAFAEAYAIILNNPVVRGDNYIAVSEKDLRQLAKGQLVAIAGYLPAVLEELVRLALHAEKEQDRIKAIDMYLSRVGVTPELITPVAQNKLTLQILNMVTPKPLGTTSIEVVQGEARMIEGGEDDEEEYDESKKP